MVAKKKSMANRLARMSDEERARYLQHRADIEEEARRRKEQLIATFLKNKIKKEEAFSRLNIAKLNQHWHQIMRKAKCKEMKENVMYMKEWIERTITLKNKAINLLIGELDEAEHQYSNNFQAHMMHIDNIIENHNEHLKNLQSQYEEDRNSLLENAAKERECFLKKTVTEQEYLLTLIYGQDVTSKRNLKESYEANIKKYDETMSNYRSNYDVMRKEREMISSAIWKQIATLLKLYVQQTDTRRMHLAELKRLDAESAVETAKNQERIIKAEEEVEKLKLQHATIVATCEDRVDSLTRKVESLTQDFYTVRKHLRSDLSKDEKQLMHLTKTSNATIKYLEDVASKGEQLLYLVQMCRKYETEKEKITRWLPLCNSEYLKEKSTPVEDEETTNELSDLEINGSSNNTTISVELSTQSSSNKILRPKTSIPQRPILKRLLSQSTLKEISFSFEEDEKIAESDTKPSKSESSKSTQSTTMKKSSKPSTPAGLLSGFESLSCLEGLWWVYNKVQLDCIELEEEKRLLLQENKNLRGTMRSILEAAALVKSVPDTKIPTRICSNKRFAMSAPQKYHF